MSLLRKIFLPQTPGRVFSASSLPGLTANPWSRKNSPRERIITEGKKKTQKLKRYDIQRIYARKRLRTADLILGGFSIADQFGLKAIQDTYNRAFEEWKNDYRYLTELTLVLNHKIWQYHKKRPDFAALYNSLWKDADQYAVENLKDEELGYYFDVTD